MTTISEFYPILIFFLMAIPFTVSPLVISTLTAPGTTGNKTLNTNECCAIKMMSTNMARFDTGRFGPGFSGAGES